MGERGFSMYLGLSPVDTIRKSKKRQVEAAGATEVQNEPETPGLFKSIMEGVTKKHDTESGIQLPFKSPGGITGFLAKMFRKLEAGLLFLIGKLKYIDKVYPKVLTGLYVVRVLFFIAIFGLFIYNIFSTPSKFVMYHAYSSLRVIYILLLAIAAGLVMSKTSDKIGEKILKNKGQPAPIPFPIMAVGSLVLMLPYLYDIVAILIIMGAVKALYIQTCDGSKTNVWPFIDGVQNVFITLAIISLVFLFVTYRLKINSIVVVPVLCACFTFLVIIFMLNGMEDTIADNINYMVGAYKGEGSPGKDCYDSDKNESDNAFTMVMNVIVSVLLVILTLIVFTIQLIPYPALVNVNMKVRDAIGQMIDKFFQYVF